jgi:integrase
LPVTTLSTKSARARLNHRREPYWTQIGRGSYLGFRSGAGTWIARYRDGDGKQHYQSLGEHEEFTIAKEQAERWLSQVTKGAHRAPSRGTVRDALSGYVRHLRSIGRRTTAWDVGQRFRLTVPRSGEFGRKKLEDTRREDFETWRNGLRKGRQPRSVNRQVRAVVAALNWAVKDGGFVGNREAWKLTHLVDDGEESTPVFLTPEQRDRLIAAASPTAAALLTGFRHTGARPSELAKATVADFDAKGGTVTLSHRKGRGAKFRSRATQLDDEGVKFFKAQTRGKLPKAPLITNEAGGHFTDQQWCREIELAIIAANKTARKPAQRIPAGASAYSFRHTRISELLQLYGIDPLTTAQQTGTSIAMIERFYFKFISSSMRDKLNAVKASPRE